MAGVSWDLLISVMFFLVSVWGAGRAFRMANLPSILGEFLAGVFLGPNFLDIVPFSSNGRCDTIIFPHEEVVSNLSTGSAGSTGCDEDHGRMLAAASGPQCMSNLLWTPRWSMEGKEGIEMHTPDIWSFAGTVGVTLLIMESGMHINFAKVRQIGGQALIVAIVGTTAPLVFGMLLTAALFGPDYMYPDGFAAGCALAPTSVGISIKLLSDAKMLNSMAGQTTLTAAFIDDVFSLVLLVLLSSLAEGNADPLVIVLKTVAAFAFLGAGVVGGKNIFPRLDPILSQIPFKKGVSIQPRDEVHLCIMLLMLALCAYIGAMIGSHLLGAFVAGMCFVSVPRSHQVWVTQLKRIIRWLIRIFFASSVGFNVPIKKMLSLEAFLNGLVLGAVPGILCKVVSGLAGRNKWKSLGERQRASKASIMTRFGLVQPIQYLVGMAMVARGEFAFLVALSASKMTLPDAEDGGSGGVMLREEVYAALTWGLVWALVLAPFLFKWALSVYMSASPIQRGMSIGGLTAAERNFVIQVIGQHHSGVLHEILNAIHGEGMDVLECRVETDGEVDTNYFVVQSRGKQKDFDDEKLEEIRHHIQEILGDENAVVMFEAIDDEDFTFAAIELQVVTASADQGEEGAVHVVSKVTKRLQELGLDVEEIDEQHKVQIDHGHETEMERDLFYAVPSKNSEEEDTITHRRVHQVKRALQSMLRDENIKAEVVVKPVADRSKGFSELQTFDPQQAISRAKGEVWELMCIGAHDVELLSTAVRKLEPLGLRLLHAAHSHTDKTEGEGADAQQQCSRIFVERRQEAAAGRDSKSEGEIYEETEEFTAKVIRVMKATYKSDDDNKFTVRPVESSALEEMSFMTRSISAAVVPGLQDLPGLVKPSPDFNEFRRGLPRGLKQIPEREPRSPMEMAFDGDGLLGGSNGPSGGATPYGEGAKTPTKPREGRRPSVPSIDPQTMTRVQELEAKVAILEALNSRVNRLEELELRIKHGGATAKLAPQSPTDDDLHAPTMLSSLGLPVQANAPKSPSTSGAGKPVLGGGLPSPVREVDAVRVDMPPSLATVEGRKGSQRLPSIAAAGSSVDDVVRRSAGGPPPMKPPL